MKTIIVAIDESPQAQNALVYAASLAKITKARIILFSSFNPNNKPVNLMLNSHSMDELVKEKRKQLEKVAVRIRNEYEIKVAYYTKLCFIEEEINELAMQLEADLIVMGIKRKLMNNNASDIIATSVIRESKFPVFVVPEGMQFKKPERILFACDYQTVPCPYTLAIIKLFALQFGAEIQIFHVENKSILTGENPLKDTIVQEIQKMMRGVKHSFHELKEKSIAEGIEKGLHNFEADILLMAPHKPGFFRSFLYKSLTREMALRGKVPVLALKD